MFIEHPLIKKGKLESRPYQEAILGRAVKTNLLVVIPTGLGKTPLAIMLAAHRLHSFPGSRVLVMAPTRPLVNQHFQSFMSFMELPESGFTVVTGVTKPSEREKVYKEKTVVIATPQTIENDLRAGSLDLRDFSLLILDETHHSIGRYAYPYVSRVYKEQAANPKILGLTASPGGSMEKIKEVMLNAGLDEVEIRTETDQDVEEYVKQKNVEYEYVELPESFLKIRQYLKDSLEKKVTTLRKLGLIRGKWASKKDLLELQGQLMARIRSRDGRAFLAITPATMALKLEHALGLLETQGVSVLEKYWVKLRTDASKASARLLKEKEVCYAMHLTNELYQAGSKHPKMSRLCTLVQQHVRRSPESRIIVFANYRESVKDIEAALSRLDGVRPAVLIGQKEGMSQKEQVEAIRRYGEGVYNCLITTSIGEEGLSLESADIAIFYESVPSEIRNIQRRGRVGRVKAGRIIFLLTKGTRDEAYYWSAYHKEKKMKSILYGMKQSAEGVKQFGPGGPPE